jgi:hypothetical protein
LKRAAVDALLLKRRRVNARIARWAGSCCTVGAPARAPGERQTK